MGAGPSLEDLIYELNSNARSIQREADKSVQQANAAREKAKQFLKENRKELAEYQAQLSAVKEQQAISFQKMSTQLQAHSGELKLLAKGDKISTDMYKVNSQLIHLLQKQDVKAAVQLLDQYKTNQAYVGVKVDVVQNVMQEQMDGVAGLTEKDSVMQRLQSEIGLEESQKQLLAYQQAAAMSNKVDM